MTAYEDHFDQYACETCEGCGDLLLFCKCEDDMNRREEELTPTTNIPIIQLQILDDLTGQNLGGLYINPQHICSLLPQKFTDINGMVFSGTRVNTVDGKSFMTPYPITEVLDMLGH